MRLTGHAYPWDVLGDPGFVARAEDVRTVALAAAYHSTRAATPLHPKHQLVDASCAALYRPVREQVWRGRRLRPAEPAWMSTSDSWGAAAEVLRAGGLRVSAWVVLTHNTRLGAEFPDVAVVNCFGDRYPYALCPANEEVREYAATLAAQAADGADEVSLEACGQLGLTHGSHHEKTDNAWTTTARRWLSVCCCTMCQKGWSARGLDPVRVASTLREAVRTSADVPFAEELLATRHASTDQLRAEVLAGLTVPVTLHAHPDPWVTGASPGLTPAVLSGLTPAVGPDVSALIVPAWPVDSAPVVAAAVATGRPVDAYVTVLQDEDGLLGHARDVARAGATGLAIYHLGLAPSWRRPMIAAMARAAGQAQSIR